MSITKMLPALALILLLSGCPAPVVKEPDVVYKTDRSTIVPAVMLVRCPVVIYFDREQYLQEQLWTEREKMLFDSIGSLMRDIKSCENNIIAIDNWRKAKIRELDNSEKGAKDAPK